MKTIFYIGRSMAMLGGTERVLSIKINWLASHGYKVILVTYEQGCHPIILSLHPNVTIININTPIYSLSKYPLFLRYFKYIRMKATFQSRLKDIFEEFHPDIVLTIAYCMNVIKEIYKSCKHAKIIMESHETYHSVTKEYMYISNPVLRIAAKLYDNQNINILNRLSRIVTLTQGDADEWRKHISTPIEIIPNPLTHYPASITNSQRPYCRIIAAGRIENVKGFDKLIKAFAIIADKCPQWRVDIFGKGSKESCLQSLIAQYRLENRIAILPPTKDIYIEYQKSDFYVLSSQHEGFGMVLIEAMSCGTPCLAYNCDYGPREIIDDGITGLLVEDGNIEQLAQKMLWMIEHSEERIRMGERARETIKKYDINTIMQNWVKLLNTCS